jgi:hypothetical protein
VSPRSRKEWSKDSTDSMAATSCDSIIIAIIVMPGDFIIFDGLAWLVGVVC